MQIKQQGDLLGSAVAAYMITSCSAKGLRADMLLSALCLLHAEQQQ